MHNFSNGSEPETVFQRETRLSRKLAVENLSTHDLQLWNNHRSVDRLQLSIGQKLVLWHFPHIWGSPAPIRTFQLTGIHVDQVEVTYAIKIADGEHQIINNQPRLLDGTGVFVWIPFINTMRHHPVDVNDQPFLTTSLCVRQQTNPMKIRCAKHQYLTTLKVFERNWEIAGVTADA